MSKEVPFDYFKAANTVLGFERAIVDKKDLRVMVLKRNKDGVYVPIGR